MSRTGVVVFAGMLGAIGSTLVLPVSEANAAMCAKPPQFSPSGCRRFRCVVHGPCEVRRFVTDRKGCLRYLCTSMVPRGSGPGKPHDQPVGGVPGGPPPR